MNNLSVTFLNYYPALNPTINNANNLQEGDFANDKTVCHSNSVNGDDSDMPATMYDLSEGNESDVNKPATTVLTGGNHVANQSQSMASYNPS